MLLKSLCKMMIGYGLKLFVKSINYGLFALLMLLLWWYKPYATLSTHLLSLLPQSQESYVLKVYEKFQSSKEVLVAIKGEDEKALQKMKALEKRLTDHSFISLKVLPFANKTMKAYQKTYRYLLQDFDETKLQDIEGKITALYEALHANPYYTQIDKGDPLAVFSQEEIPSLLMLKNGHLYLADFGYVSIFTADEGASSEAIYDAFMQESGENIKLFSPLFYFVENAAKIKSDVNVLIYCAAALLMLLYGVILKNIALLMHTTLVLLSGAIVALFVVTSIWDEVSLFVTVFGVAISTVAIDYMFHHYLCGYYAHKREFNKAVFFGFFSTFFAFLTFSFVPFALIQQVSVFALVSLSYAYLLFAFYFPRLRFAPIALSYALPSYGLLKTKHYKYLALGLAGVLMWLGSHSQIDLNIQTLDYNNTKLKEVEAFFKEKLSSQDNRSFVFKASDIDGLIAKARKIKDLHVKAYIPLAALLDKEAYRERVRSLASFDFEKVREKIQHQAQALGFREGYFKEAYSFEAMRPNEPVYDLALLRTLGMDVYYDGVDYFSYGVNTVNEGITDAIIVDGKNLFSASLRAVYNELFLCGLVVFGIILLLFYVAVKERFFKALCFLLFPLAVCLLVISFAPINILQIFMLFVILALSMDYGIYMSQQSVSKESQTAILFSLMSTFAGFGVLIFSSIGVLFFVGEVATLGLFAVVILLVVSKHED